MKLLDLYYNSLCFVLAKCDGANESLLVRPCDLNCYSLDEKCDSLKSCKEGCFCNIGFARDHKNICVRLPKCPRM